MVNKTGFISQEQKEQVLQATDIVHLVEDYVQLKASGKNHIGLCPFHREKTPSFVVSSQYQNYKCYGCGEFGDAIRFVMEMENLPFTEALSFLAQRVGVKLNLHQKRSDSVEIHSEIDDCLEKSFRFFRENLSKASPASSIWSYLKERAINEREIEDFQLGFVGPGWTNLHDSLLKKGVSTKVQEKAGLIKQGEKGGMYDRMRNRLIFPIRDKQNRLLGFAGRSIGDDMPKYLNPPETDLYKKSVVLYGIHTAHEQIRKRRRAIIVEGYLDVIRLHEQLWKETVATCGTSVTENHIKIIKRLGAEEVILLFDGDQAGIKAAERTARLFIVNDLDARVVVLPDEMDPDEYFKKYTSADFQKLIDNAVFDFEFVISQSKKAFESKGIEQRESIIKEVIGLTNEMKSTIKADLFLSKAASEYRVDKIQLKKLIVQAKTEPSGASANKEPTTLPVFGKEYLPEIKLLQYIMNHVEAIEIARKEVTPFDFIHRDLADIYARFLQLTDDEFKMLSARDFPELFIEHSTLLMHLLHYDVEYKGPVEIRPGSEELQKLKSENEKLTGAYSEKAFITLIERMKRHRRRYDLRMIRHMPRQEDDEKETVRQFVEARKKMNQNAS